MHLLPCEENRPRCAWHGTAPGGADLNMEVEGDGGADGGAGAAELAGAAATWGVAGGDQNMGQVTEPGPTTL